MPKRITKTPNSITADTYNEPRSSQEEMDVLENAIRYHMATAERRMEHLVAELRGERASPIPFEEVLRAYGDEILAALQEAISIAHQRSRLEADLRTEYCMDHARAHTAQLLGEGNAND